MVSFSAFKGKTKNQPKLALGVGLALLVITIVAGTLIYNDNHASKGNKSAQANQEMDLANKALLKGNKMQALAYAKKALADAPNSIGNIQLVAYLMKAQDPAAAKQYYVQAFDKFKQQNNLNGATVTAVNYWGAAGMAMQAGETSQAIKYYQEVIQTARPSNAYEQSLAEQSQAEIERLQ